ncbi:MAG: signal recognition particle receptor subunit alpha, partial [Clostridia bacterium]|nr:signal recognition particle receptor subunit alpha [Clostridia bacterium]
MKFFDKLKAGLSKTKNAFVGKIDDMLKVFVRVDEDLLDELEEILYCSDMGAETTEEVIESLRARIKDGRLKEPEDVKSALKEILRS